MHRKIYLYMMTALCAAKHKRIYHFLLKVSRPRSRGAEEHRMKLGLSMTYYNRNADIYTQGSNYFLTPLQQKRLLILLPFLMKIAINSN